MLVILTFIIAKQFYTFKIKFKGKIKTKLGNGA